MSVIYEPTEPTKTDIEQIKESIDSILDCCAAGMMKREEIISQIWLALIVNDENSRYIH